VELIYVGIGIVIGVVVALFLDVNRVTKKDEEKEEKIDTKEEHNEGK